MLEKGATNYNKTMEQAVYGGHKEIMERMLEKGATDYDWAMAPTAWGGHKEIIDLIQRWKDKKR